MADEETTCEPKRTLPTISFCLIPCDIGILMTFQGNSNYGTVLSCLDTLRIPSVICRRSSSHIFCQNELIRMPDECMHAFIPCSFFVKTSKNLSECQESACALLNNLLILIFCFIASITATISSEVPSPGKGHHHILLFEELSRQISSDSFNLIWYSNLPLPFLTPLPFVAPYPQLHHSHNFPVPWMGTLSLPRWVLPKYICKRKIISLTESSISLEVAHTYPYRSFVVFKQRTTF